MRATHSPTHKNAVAFLWNEKMDTRDLKVWCPT